MVGFGGLHASARIARSLAPSYRGSGGGWGNPLQCDLCTSATTSDTMGLHQHTVRCNRPRRNNLTAQYEAALSIQHTALTTDAKVIIFPETVVPTWTPATEAFWQPTLDRLRSAGRTIVVGVPVTRRRLEQRTHTLRGLSNSYQYPTWWHIAFSVTALPYSWICL
jgi:hypothetical protein